MKGRGSLTGELAKNNVSLHYLTNIKDIKRVLVK